MRLTGTGRLRASAPVIVAAAAVIAAGAWLFAPAIEWLVRTWRVHPYYGHGVALPFVAGWLLWRQRRDFLPGADGVGGGAGEDNSEGAPGVSESRLDSGSNRSVLATEPLPTLLPMIALVSSVALAVFASRTGLMPLAAFALVGTLWSFAGIVSGLPGLRAAAAPAGLLALGVPVPITERLAPGLAAQVAKLAANATMAIGIPVIRAGAQLTIGDGHFVVGAPCSGLRSGLALITVAYVAAALMDSGMARRWLVVVLALPVALAANWLRLTGLLTITHLAGSDLGLAVFEGPASPVLFVGATGLLLWVAHWGRG